jgi:pyruvate formate lyase activating enzyme
MQIKGLIKDSLIDYPGHIATVVFTGGCNFGCPFCQNGELVTAHQDMADIPPDQLLALLKERQGFIDGLVITGGEPTLQPDLAGFMADVKALGVAIKLDTNGYLPDRLAALLSENLADDVAMDIKAAPANYDRAAGTKVDLTRIERSIALLQGGQVPYEFRTTVVPGLVGPDDVPALAALLAGATRYTLQQYRPEGVLDPDWRQVAPYPLGTLEAMAARLKAAGIPTTVRGG